MPQAIKVIILQLLFFYFTYPQAISIRGSAFTFYSGIIGLFLYVYNHLPFKKEVIISLLGFAAIILACNISALVNSLGITSDAWVVSYIRSQMGWFFTAYLLIGILFKIHNKPTIFILFGYVIGAVALQCAISLTMHYNEPLKEFLFSIQHQAVFDERARSITEKQRLIGYGTGLFGAGFVCGYALILLTYVIMRIKLKKKQFILLIFLYFFIFFIGLFNARTTTVGLGFSLIFLAILYITDHRNEKKRVKLFIVSGVIFFIAGYMLCAEFFPEYSEWAFELFNSMSTRGDFHTDSSEGLIVNLVLPSGFKTRLFGTGSSVFFGTDVGYTRMFVYFGVIGTFFYFFYDFIILKQCMTKDWSITFLYIVIMGYILALNIKGWTDLNPMLYLLLFFFAFYKYEIYYPKVELHEQRLKKLKETKSSNQK